MATNKKSEMVIAGRKIGNGDPPYVIAEISANHNGSLERALKTMDAAAAAGVDAVKIQTYTADTITIDCDGPGFRIEGGLWDGYTLHKLYEEAHTPYEWHASLFEHARDRGVTLFSSPFDDTAVDLLSRLQAPAYKIASFEMIDLPLIRRVARERKPMIISTGMGTLAEIDDAVAATRDAGVSEIALLHCVSSYPAPVADANLRTISHLAAAFGTVVGLSDHTPGTAVAVAAVAMGARIVEKHFTLSRGDGGPDASFSLEPDELKRLVADCRDAWSALGRVSYDRPESEKGSMVFRRSLYVVADTPKGTVLDRTHVRSIRPGYGLAPKHLDRVLGRRAARDLKRGEPLAWRDVSAD